MSPIQPGATLDHYRIDSLVAHSGMASIYRGTDLRNGRQVAIKIPHPEVESDPVFFDRFRREEEIGKTLDHPGVMKVYTDEQRSQLYMVMEWVEGRLLRQILNEQGKLPPERAARIAMGICEVLEYIHQQGIVHRDLKPDNIMVADDDRVKLIDFGIAAKAGSRASDVHQAFAGDGHGRIHFARAGEGKTRRRAQRHSMRWESCCMRW